MKRLTPKEEDIMQALWDLKQAFVKEVQAQLPEQLHYNTVSTMIRNLEQKGFVSHESFGNAHRYFALISKEEYTKFFMKNVSEFLFGDSYKSMVSFFAKEEKISAEDLEDIIKLIEQSKN